MATTMKSKKTQMRPLPTLLQAIERVVETAKDSKLSDQFMLKAAPEIGLLADRYGITERQAVLFCVCMEKGPRHVDYDDLANYLDVSQIKILSYASDIDALVRRRMLRYRDANDEDTFDVPIPVIKALKHNEVYELPPRTGLNCAEVFELLDQWFEDLDNDAINAKEMAEEAKNLLDDNQQVAFAKHVKEYYLSKEDLLMLLAFCHLLVNKGDDDIRIRQLEDLFERKCEFISAKARLQNGEHKLMTKKLIEYRCEDGIADNTRYKLTESAKRILLEELNIHTTDEHLADVVKAGKLTSKQLFFPKDIERQVDELTSLLSPEKYDEIHQRMKQTGFRTGFACLFYGGPGTGKTETVYQLARQTGRDIMVVEVPRIKSKWVGDSEKNIKALFDRYRELVKRTKLAPILLFNEADAIIGKRKSEAESAVDKMENSIQNIILQEMENLDGIMIATTNLQQNLDSAFERRFLYKIKFEKPSVEARSNIWQSMIPELERADARKLAEKYNLSGGQIENVARKHSISTILHGKPSDLAETLSAYCSQEQIADKSLRKIGF